MIFKNNERGGSLTIILIVLFLLVGLGGGGFFLYKTKLQKKTGPSKDKLPHVNMSDEVVGFTYRILPSLYNKLIALNREISLINIELGRIETLESDFPKQKSIIKTEKLVWEKTKKRLMSVLTTCEKKIETLYVAYSVNEGKGKERIENETADLLRAADEIIDASKVETARIHIERPKTFMEKLKTKIVK